jgi:hypothetical protein
MTPQEAKEHAKKIKDAVADLNLAIREGHNEGVYVQIAIRQVQQIGCQYYDIVELENISANIDILECE